MEWELCWRIHGLRGDFGYGLRDSCQQVEKQARWWGRLKVGVKEQGGRSPDMGEWEFCWEYLGCSGKSGCGLRDICHQGKRRGNGRMRRGGYVRDGMSEGLGERNR